MRLGIGIGPSFIAGATAAISPITIFGASVGLWTRGDLGVSSTGGNVDQWADQSGNGNHLVATSTARPVFNASDADHGGKPSLLWNGTSTTMRTTGAISYGAHALYLVVKNTADCYFAVHKDGSTEYWYSSTGLSSFIVRSAVSCSANLGAGWGQNAAVRTLVRYFNGTVAGHGIRINGVDQGASVSGTDPGTGALSDFLYLGSSQVPSSFLSGSISEVILVTRAPTVPEHQQVEAYLRARYNHY